MTPAVSRERAWEIAEAYVRDIAGWSDIKGIRTVVDWDEITWRKPQVFNRPLEGCWIVYVDRIGHGLWSSTILLISQKSGEIVYAGTAEDEG